MTEAELSAARHVAELVPPLAPDLADRARSWLLEVTALPTAAGREARPIAWIKHWVSQRPELTLTEDASGNLVVAFGNAPAPEAVKPLFITAHLDHPAFVLEAINPDGTLSLTFRGGVLDAYFENAPIDLVPDDDAPVRATLTSAGPADPLRACTATLERAADASRLAPGTVGRWALPDPAIINGVLNTHACDDLAAVVAALSAIENLRLRHDAAGRHTRLLFTRAEEVGFIGAYAACRDRTMPTGSRAILLENSRAFPESPIDGGVIVRVGDRLTTFTPDFTASIARTAELLDAGRQATPDTQARAFQPAPGAGLKWQRKLMPGGACEATCYQAFGYESACLCLPLGNYHNMANLTAVQAKEPAAVATARCGPEQIAINDFVSMVELLTACAVAMSTVEPVNDLLTRIYDKASFVLNA